MRLRDLLTWKFLFYEAPAAGAPAAGPGAARRGPRRAGAVAAAAWPPRRRALAAALARAGPASRADWAPERSAPALAANSVRFLARDYPLDDGRRRRGPRPVRRRGLRALRAALAEGRGAILVGSHLGRPHRGASTGCIAAGSRSGCWCSGPSHVSASWTGGSTATTRRTRSRASSSAAACRPARRSSACSAPARRCATAWPST